jgi:hypothetical protein
LEKKLVFQKLLKSDPVMNARASTFILGNISSEDISDLSEDLMSNLFDGKSDATLSLLSHITFTKNVATAKAFVTPQRLHPTTSFPSQRVYFHIMLWMGMPSEMEPNEWGWKQERDKRIPIMTEKECCA